MRGTCAILCACVPSGCFLPSRADLPSLARLPLVSRGVFIAGDYHSQGPDRINGEETMTAAESADLAQRFDPRDVQEKWQARWAELDPFRASEDPADPRERFYLVDMFPYPSGDLHMGHAEAYAIGDALARYHFLRGKNVLHPIGWDAFGLPAENAAIRNNTHPADWTYANIEMQAASFRRYAVSFDWSRRLQTCDPEYYHWNQWLFLRFYERGLAYRKDGYVNWCPVDQTVLANEQVIAGHCERCGSEVIRRLLTQWYFKITEYADQLLSDMAPLEGNWPDRVLLMQRNWIGRSEGAEIRFPVKGERIPVWAADYVLTDYGTGAIMAVPAHDQRDLDFARTHGLAVWVVVETGEPDPAVSGVATHGDGTLVNSGPIDGLDKVAAIAMITEILAEQGQGRAAVSYRLRDWLVSRQRFWGTPIPIVYCEGCGEVPVPDDQLPVVLPDLRGQDLAPKGVSPLAAAEDWVNTECPKCGGAARRDTDTMDTFVDSSWYFLRYCSPGYQHGPFDVEAVRRWSPVDLYVGGVEHAILHLMYSRFFVKVLHDMGMIDFAEPFTLLLNQGQVINQGRAMSKSLGNGVDLGEQLAGHGVDAVRLTMIFASPPEDDIDWADVRPEASVKFLGRAWRLAVEAGAAATRPGAGDGELRKVTHRTIDEFTRLVESSRLNVAVARLMEL